MPFVEMQDRRVNPERVQGRTPPTPSSSSWRIRTRASPPYSRAVSDRSDSVFWGTFESRSSSVVRPTSTRQTCACSTPVVVSTATKSG